MKPSYHPRPTPVIRALGLLALVLTLTLAPVGCAKIEGPALEAQTSAPAAPANPALPVQVDPSAWEIHEQQSHDGSARITHSDMPGTQRERARNEYRQTSLLAVPVDASFNVSIFKIKEVPEWANMLFIAPRLYAYGGAEGGRLAPQRHPDGTVSLAFPVILTDGTRAQIPSPDAKRDIDLPPSFLINDINRLRSALGAAPGGPMALSPLPGCPTRIVLKISDQEIDVTPSDLAQGDYCQLDKPFILTVRLPEEQARYMLEEALYANAVEIRAIFETRVSFVDSRASVSFDKSKLFHSIEAEIQIHAGAWADVDAQAHVTNIVKNEALSINIQGDAGPIVDNIVGQAIQAFFEKYTPDPSTGLKPCGPAIACLRLNYNYDRQQDSFTFSWTHTTAVLTGQNYLTWTQLSPVLDKVSSIGNGTRADGQARPALSSNNARGIETGLTVVPGDLLEITPTYLIKEEREWGVPRLEHVSNLTCVSWAQAEDRQVCRSRRSPHGGDPDIECRREHVPAQCQRTEDHWIETTTYSTSSPRYPKIDQPIGQMQQIFDGLALRFVWRNPSDGRENEVTCPLNLFSRKGDGKSLVVRLENRGDACRIFTEDPAIQPMLYLVNRIDFPVSYKDGREIRTWDGRVLEMPVQKIYHPETQFAGLISIRGYSFAGSASHGEHPRTL